MAVHSLRVLPEPAYSVRVALSADARIATTRIDNHDRQANQRREFGGSSGVNVSLAAMRPLAPCVRL
jgi:hypothetical protein